MNQMTDSRELARRFNEDEAVWQRYEDIRARRLLLSVASVLPDEVQDALDWIEAKRRCTQTRAIAHGLEAGTARRFNARSIGGRCPPLNVSGVQIGRATRDDIDMQAGCLRSQRPATIQGTGWSFREYSTMR